MVIEINLTKRKREGPFGTKTEDDDFEIRDQILYLDERLLILRRTPVSAESTKEPITQIYERLLSEGEEEPVRSHF